MTAVESITFVVAVNNQAVLKANFLASPCFGRPHSHEIIIREGFPSAAAAYNGALDESRNDLVVFAHQDVVFPEEWLTDVARALEHLSRKDPDWGVLGAGSVEKAYVYSSGLGVIGEPFEEPFPVRTLDEMVLILRKSSGLRFDDRLPHFHMYGPDVCLTAEASGRKNYAISAFCVHNTQPSLVLPREFYKCYHYVRRKWRDRLPIRTTCIEITRWNEKMYKRRLQDLYFHYIRPKQYGARASDGCKLLVEAKALADAPQDGTAS